MAGRLIALLVIVCGCGDSSPTPDASVDARVDPACDAQLPFAAVPPARVLRVGAGAISTISIAAAAATPGTQILLAPGIHAPDQYLDLLRGTATAPISIKGEPGAVIVGGRVGLRLSRAQYVVVEDLELRGQTEDGIRIDDGSDTNDAAHHIILARLHVHDVGMTAFRSCIQLSGVTDLAVVDSRFSGCGVVAGSGIDHVGCHRGVIARNTFDAMSGNSVRARGGSTEIDIRQNRARDGGERVFSLGGSTPLASFRPPLVPMRSNAEARRIRVFDNIITGTVTTPFAFVGCVHCLVAHNTVVTPARTLVGVHHETVSQGEILFEPPSALRVINNTFVYNASALSTHLDIDAAISGSVGVEFSHNAWLASDDPSRSAPTLPASESGQLAGMPSIYATTPSDPLAPLGPPACAHGAEPGRGAGFTEVPGTIEGACRARDTAHTIGAQHCP